MLSHLIVGVTQLLQNLNTYYLQPFLQRHQHLTQLINKIPLLLVFSLIHFLFILFV